MMLVDDATYEAAEHFCIMYQTEQKRLMTLLLKIYITKYKKADEQRRALNEQRKTVRGTTLTEEEQQANDELLEK